MQEKISLLMAVLMNKLATNDLPSDWRPAFRRDIMTVKLTPSGAAITTPEALLTAMIKEWDADVQMFICTRTTGFGVGVMCEKSEIASHARQHALTVAPCRFCGGRRRERAQAGAICSAPAHWHCPDGWSRGIIRSLRNCGASHTLSTQRYASAAS